MARLVERWDEMKEIFDELNRAAGDYSLPVRGMLQFVLNGKLSTGKLYVNHDRSVIAVLHELSEYSTIDGDTMAVYIKTADDLIQQFFHGLSEERLWNQRRRIILLTYIRDDFKELVKSMLPDLICDDLGSYQLQNVPRSMNDWPTVTLPPGFRMTPGKIADAQKMVDAWDYIAPDKLKMFQWMLEKFPSITIRDSDDNPVAWTLTYSCGGSAAFYVKPEFRRLYFGRAMTKEICHQHERLLPCPRFAGVSRNNSVAVAFNYENTGVITTWLLFRSRNSISKM